MVEVVPYESQYKGDWNDLVARSKNGTFLFNRDFMEYHSDRFADCSKLVFDKGKLAAVFPANIESKTAHSHQGLTYGGLVTRREVGLIKTLEYFKELLQTLDRDGVEKVIYKQVPQFLRPFPSQEESYALFLLDAELCRRDSALVIDLNDKLPYQEVRKRAVKKGGKNNIAIREDRSFDDFWNELLVPNLRERYGVVPVHSEEEISRLGGLFPENIRQFNAYSCDGALRAGTTVFVTPEVAHAQYITASDEGRKDGSLDLLFDSLINEEFSDKRFFDFGICNEDDGRTINHGLLFWKESFGARTYTHDFYEILPANHVLLDPVLAND